MAVDQVATGASADLGATLEQIMATSVRAGIIVDGYLSDEGIDMAAAAVRRARRAYGATNISALQTSPDGIDIRGRRGDLIARLPARAAGQYAYYHRDDTGATHRVR